MEYRHDKTETRTIKKKKLSGEKIMKIKTSPSLLACDFLHLADEVKRAEESDCDMLHCDVMDGMYVPNISFGFDIIKKIHSITTLPLDVHMMTAAPQKYIDVLHDAGAASITIHHDVMPKEELVGTLEYIRSLGMKAAVSLKPAYPAADAFDFVPYCDMILVMTVEPGFGGQKFMDSMLPKIREIREYLDKNKPECDIEVDGGIGEFSIADRARAGANVFVIGTASFRAEDMKGALDKLVSIAEQSAIM